ncbi:MAG: cation diffusion facilitator family transporter, partial [Eggerthellaceae bacterium]|nr:cation diffusion facilitator family transporter [Eggerthellaceae bacterium]
RRAGKRLQSEILTSDAAHTLSDAMVSTGVIIGLILVALGVKAADPIMALIVTVAIIISAVEVFRAAFRTLSDHARLPSEQIVDIVSSIDGISDVHHVRTRGTESEIYCDLHILVSPTMSVVCAHGLGYKAEDAIKSRFPNVKEVLVHIEPVGDPGADE